MKTLVISDLHANIIALEAVWRQESDADRIIFAGDVVDYGPFPRECIEWLIDKKVVAVAGNHDLGVIRAYEHPEDGHSRTWRMDNARKLDPEHIEYLKHLPESLVLEIDGRTYGLTHAYRKYEIIRSVEAFTQFTEERFSQSLPDIVFGHTHRREIHHLSDEHAWLNPGSLSYRRSDETFRGAHYAVILDGKPSLRSLPYPVERLHREVLAADVRDSEKQALFPSWAPK